MQLDLFKLRVALRSLVIRRKGRPSQDQFVTTMLRVRVNIDTFPLALLVVRRLRLMFS